MQLSAKNLGFYYRQNEWVFRHVHLTINSGEIVGLQGDSGKGKTTFCKVLASYVTPSEGSVHIEPVQVRQERINPIQMIFQHPELAVNPRWKGKRIISEANVIDWSLLAQLGISNAWLEKWPHELSGGELQRLCIARALNAHPKFLIADEMTTMLDAITQAQLWNRVRMIAEERNMGILIVSHDQSLLNRLCTRVIQF